MAMKLLVLGLPGSGKSSTARYIATSARDKSWRATHHLTLWGTNETAHVCGQLEMGKASRPPSAEECYWLPLERESCMPKSQSGDISAITTSVDHRPEHQTLQGGLDPYAGSGTSNSLQSTQPTQPAEGSSLEQIRLSLLRTNNALCIILTMGPLVASTFAFCITRSPLSFVALLPVLSQASNIRRRLEESAFPISLNDLQIRLKELDVEAKRIEKQSTIASLPLFSWLRRLLNQSSK